MCIEARRDIDCLFPLNLKLISSLFTFLYFRYERLLRRARTEDLSEISGIGCLYQSGYDRVGRPVIVFCGKWFPVNDIDLEKVRMSLYIKLKWWIINRQRCTHTLQALLYLIQLLDPIVKGDYVIAYFHTLTSTSNYPPLNWLKEVYSILPYKWVEATKLFMNDGDRAIFINTKFHFIFYDRYKKNLKAFYIVHPTFWTKMVSSHATVWL